MKNNVTKLNRVNKMFAITFVLIATGLINQIIAQQYSHRPKASKFTQQGSTNAAANTAFSSGRDLIDDAQWAKAEQTFAQYIAAYPQEKNLDAALYWMAYAQSKLKKFDKSKDTVEKLLKTYQKTIWKEDAELLLAQLPTAIAVKVDPVIVDINSALAIAPVAITTPNVAVAVAPPQDPIRAQEMQERIAEAQARAIERNREAQERMQERIQEAQERAKAVSLYGGKGMSMGIGIGDNDGPDDDPCEFKIVVLQALVESDPQRGIAVANDWLKPGSAQTPTCKRAALRVLSRHGGKAALPTILNIAKTEADLKIKTTAISLLGASNDDTVVNDLRDFAINSPQPEVGEAALSALSQHNSPQALNAVTDIAMSTKPIALRKTAIRSIAGRPGEPAVDALFKIYDSSQDLEIRKSVVSGFGNRKSERAGAKLVEIARGSDNVELRKAAIRAIGNRGGAGAVDMLMGLFEAEKDESIKDQIMNALANSQDKRVTMKLIEIAKNPQTPIERRRRAIMLLSNRGKDPDVIKYFEELLKQ